MRRWFRNLLAVVSTLTLAAILWSASVFWRVVSYGDISRDEYGDAAVVLGAAARSFGPSPALRARVEHAVHLYRDGRVRFLVLTGGVGPTHPYAESEIGRTFAVGQGVPSDRILIDTVSTSTLGNLQEARRIVQDRRLGRTLIVSDPLHMWRAMQLAISLGLQASPSPTPTSVYTTPWARARFALRETAAYARWYTASF